MGNLKDILMRKTSNVVERYQLTAYNHRCNSCAEGNDMLDIIKRQQWINNETSKTRRNGLTEDFLIKDFERVQEKLLLEENLVNMP